MKAAALQRLIAGRGRIIAFVAVLIAALYLLAVAPVRTYFQQREAMDAAERRYEVLAEASSGLEARAGQLRSDAEIARLARERYELVPEGKQVFAVMPSVVTPNPSVAEPPSDHKQSFWERTVDDVVFWN